METNTIWVVVLVKRGITSAVEAYQNLDIAQERADLFEKHANLVDDDVNIFEVEIDKVSENIFFNH